MATLNELSFDVLNRINGGRSTNNEFISLEQIKFNINYYRSLILHRDLRRGQNTEYFEQELCPVEFEHVTQVHKEEVEYHLKSVKQIPNIIRLDYQYPLYIHDRLAGDIFPVENYHRVRFQAFNRFTKNDPRAYLRNDYLYLTKDLYAEYINSTDEHAEEVDETEELIVRGIFENPSKVYIFNGTDPLKADDQHYPCSEDINQRICESLITGTFKLIKQTIPDLETDTIPPVTN